jgi:hypothetical protein
MCYNNNPNKNESFMKKLHVKIISSAIMLLSTSAAAQPNMPASMDKNYTNKLNWYRPVGAPPPSQIAPKPNFVQHANPQGIDLSPLSMNNKAAQQGEAQSQTNSAASDDKIVAGVKLGTLGYGVEVGKMLNNRFGTRGNIQYAKAKTSDTINNIAYSAETDWLTAGALLDYYPIESSGFRFTGGGYVGNNDLKFSATPSGDTIIGANTYTTSDIGTINGKAKTNMFAPYAGLGYNSFKQDFGNWNVNVDAGVKFNGSPDVSLAATGGGVSDADLSAESSKIQEDLDLTEFYPVAGLTVGYKF